MMHSLLQDFRYGLRMLRKNPGFTAVAVLTLALGIGANTVIFTVVNAVFLRPLPFPEPERLMWLAHAYPALKLEAASISPLALAYYRDNAKSFEHLGAFTGFRAPQNLTGTGAPQRVQSMSVSGGFFPALRVPPLLGRAILPEDDVPGRRVVVLSHALWQRSFGGDPGVLNRTLALDGQNYNIIGVMPPTFQFPSNAELWVPLGFTPEQWQEGTEFMNVVARLAPGVTPEQASAELTAITAQVRTQFPQLTQVGWSVYAISLRQALVGDFRPAVLVLMGAVACVLLIACANIANLLLVRATARQKEIAIRAALGASRVRLLRQMLAEGVLLSLLGGVAGLAIGVWGVDALLALVPIEIPKSIAIALDGRVLAFTFALAVFTGLFFGAAPALQFSSKSPHEPLKESGRSSAISGRGRLRGGLATSEVALALLLLIGAGLMIRSFTRLQQANPGFDPENALTFSVALPPGRYDRSAQARFFEQVLERISALPGVSAAGAASGLPLQSGWTSTVVVQGKDFEPNPHVYMAIASPGYTQALRVPLLKGRFFERFDKADSLPVAVIDEKFAKAYFPGEDPVGKRVSLTFGEGSPEKPLWREIVGVVGAVRQQSSMQSLTSQKGQMYLPLAQFPDGSMRFVVRTSGDPLALATAARNAVLEVDSEQPIFEVTTMQHILREAAAQPRFNMVLLALFAGLALTLAGVGIYGVISYSVAQRSYEFGVRMALGARPAQVLQLVLRSGLRLAGLGLLAGLLMSFVATRALSGMLFGISAIDPLTYLTLPLVLLFIALLASYVPARRAMKVDPMVALRSE